MSVTIEDKIELFSKLIFGNIEDQSSQKKRKLADAYKKELEELALEVEKRKKEMMDAAVTKAEREKTKLTAQAKNLQQHKLIFQKQQAMQEVMERLHTMAAEFTSSSEYKSYMEKTIAAALKTLGNSSIATLYVMEKDLQLCKEIVEKKLAAEAQQLRYEVKKASSSIIGGIVVEDTEKLLQLDLTIKAVIDEKRDLLGAAITRRFNEVSSL